MIQTEKVSEFRRRREKFRQNPLARKYIFDQELVRFNPLLLAILMEYETGSCDLTEVLFRAVAALATENAEIKDQVVKQFNGKEPLVQHAN